MYCVYIVTLIVLVFILLLLWKEELKIKQSIIHGKADKFWVLRERRRYIRFNDEIKIRYNTLHKSPDFFSSKTKNISKNGIAFVSYEKLKEKTYIDIEMGFLNSPKPIKIIGEVIWTKDLETQDEQGRRLFYIGIEIAKISRRDEIMLISHLKTLKACHSERSKAI